MSFVPTGTVYGTLLNFRGEWEAWAPQMNEAPYKAPPKAPVLYVKTGQHLERRTARTFPCRHACPWSRWAPPLPW